MIFTSRAFPGPEEIEARSLPASMGRYIIHNAGNYGTYGGKYRQDLMQWDQMHGVMVTQNTNVHVYVMLGEQTYLTSCWRPWGYGEKKMETNCNCTLQNLALYEQRPSIKGTQMLYSLRDLVVIILCFGIAWLMLMNKCYFASFCVACKTLRHIGITLSRVCLCVCLFVWLSHFRGSHTSLCFAGNTCII